MKLLTQNQSNNVYFTVNEAITLTATPIYFLFRFVSYTTQDEILFTAPNISTNTLRYDLFNITLTGSSSWQNLTNGTIYMKPEGEWIYEVYEQYSPTNLFLSGTSGVILETGLIRLSGTPNTYINQTYSGSPSVFNYYQG